MTDKLPAEYDIMPDIKFSQRTLTHQDTDWTSGPRTDSPVLYQSSWLGEPTVHFLLRYHKKMKKCTERNFKIKLQPGKKQAVSINAEMSILYNTKAQETRIAV